VDPPIEVDTKIPDFVHALNIGATAETHYVTTSDGYILTVFRMPAMQQNLSSNTSHSTPPEVVYLQHGILASAWDWLVNVNGMATAIRLWEAGYEVWLGNSRGNSFSLNHTTLKVDSKEFWNYTFEEMGERDLPAQVDYFLTTSGARQLTYVGWSQGNTQMFIGGVSEVPYQPLGGAPATTVGAFLAAHVTHHIALSPVVYLEHAQSLLIKFLAEAGVANLIDVRAQARWARWARWARGRVGPSACMRASSCVNLCVHACVCVFWLPVLCVLRPGGGPALARPDNVVWCSC
jgi:pimeloyl-ACP methyl ester carboxylesterase